MIIDAREYMKCIRVVHCDDIDVHEGHTLECCGNGSFVL